VLKKAGVVAAVTAGVALIGAPAFAGVPHHGFDTPHQVGVVNVDDVHALNDVHVLENVNIPVCATHIPIGAGVVGVAVDALNPSMIKDCVDGAAVSHSGDHHGG